MGYVSDFKNKSKYLSEHHKTFKAQNKQLESNVECKNKEVVEKYIMYNAIFIRLRNKKNKQLLKKYIYIDTDSKTIKQS